jgi:hypothetical protein
MAMPFPAPLPAHDSSAHPQRDFLRDGFVALPRALPASSLAVVRRLLDELYEVYDSLPAGVAHDVGGDGSRRPPRNPEINNPARLRPALLEGVAFQRCTEVARELLGGPVEFTGDHAIYKPPFNAAETAWHQDFAYSAGIADVPDALHFWVPLQDTGIETGCMRFLPGSHRDGLRQHVRLHAASTNGTLTATGVGEERAVVCPLPLGGLTVHAPLTLHAAGANNTAGTRRAWILHFQRRRSLPRRLASAARGALLRIVR